MNPTESSNTPISNITDQLENFNTKKDFVESNQQPNISSGVITEKVSPRTTINESNTNSATNTTPQPPLPQGWVKCYSNREKRDYWFHAASGKSVWQRPK
jgi:hypothetical protein